MRLASLVLLLSIAVSGCGFFEGGDGPTDTGPDSSFSISYYGGSQFDFSNADGDIGTADYDGVNTLIWLRGRKLNDGTHAYNIQISFAGKEMGTYSVGSGTSNSSYVNVDTITDGGDWDGAFNASTDGCSNPGDVSSINNGYTVISGYGPVGGRVIGTFNFTYRSQMQCGNLKRFTGTFNVPRCNDNRDLNTEPCF